MKASTPSATYHASRTARHVVLWLCRGAQFTPTKAPGTRKNHRVRTNGPFGGRIDGCPDGLTTCTRPHEVEQGLIYLRQNQSTNQNDEPPPSVQRVPSISKSSPPALYGLLHCRCRNPPKKNRISIPLSCYATPSQARLLPANSLTLGIPPFRTRVTRYPAPRVFYPPGNTRPRISPRKRNT